MQPPVTIEKLMEMWAEDAKIDETEPGRELLRIPNLHAKYLRILTHHNLVAKKVVTDYNRMKKLKWEYYSGDLNNEEDLAKYGFEPLLGKILRQDIPIYLDSDQQLTDLLLKKVMHEEIVSICNSIMKELTSRTYQLRTFVDWERFTSGG